MKVERKKPKDFLDFDFLDIKEEEEQTQGKKMISNRHEEEDKTIKDLKIEGSEEIETILELKTEKGEVYRKFA